MPDDEPGGSQHVGPQHDGGALAGAMRLLAARRRLVQATARAQLAVLQDELQARPISDGLPAFNAAVTAALNALTQPGGAVAPEIAAARNLLRRLARERRTEPAEIVAEAVLAWLSIWSGSVVRDYKPPLPLPARLTTHAGALARGAELAPAVLNRQIEQALRDQGGLDGIITPQQLRGWTTLQRYSFEVMPRTPGELHGARCSLGHFRAIAGRVPATDRNTPRTLAGIYEMFWRFCECCVGVAHPPVFDLDAPLPAPRSRGRTPQADAADTPEAGFAEQAEAVAATSPEAADAKIAALLGALAAVLPPARQVVAAQLLVRRARIGGVWGEVLSPALVARYPWLLTEPLGELADGVLAGRLGLDAAAFADERAAAQRWLKTIVATILARRGEPTTSR